MAYFSKIDVRLIQLIHTYSTVTCFHPPFEYFCTTKGLKVSENRMRFIISDLYFYHGAVTLHVLSNCVLFRHFHHYYLLLIILMLKFRV